MDPTSIPPPLGHTSSSLITPILYGGTKYSITGSTARNKAYFTKSSLPRAMIGCVNLLLAIYLVYYKLGYNTYKKVCIVFSNYLFRLNSSSPGVTTNMHTQLIIEPDRKVLKPKTSLFSAAKGRPRRKWEMKNPVAKLQDNNQVVICKI